jgi:hypothetical protein
MANWKWMFPPQSCGECICVKKVWRSYYSGSSWGPPILLTEDLAVACAEGHGWQLVSNCVAEFVQYERCNHATSAPPTPTIPAPNCSPAGSCAECFASVPSQVSVFLPGNWGAPNPAIGVPPLESSCTDPYEEPPCPGSVAMNPCAQIPDLTFVMEMMTYSEFLGRAPCAGAGFTPRCSISWEYCNAIAAGSYCTTVAGCRRDNGLSYNFPLTIKLVVGLGRIGGICRVLSTLEIAYTVGCNGGFGSTSRVSVTEFTSAPLAVIPPTPVTLTKASTCGAFPVAATPVCDAIPSTIEATFAA